MSGATIDGVLRAVHDLRVEMSQRFERVYDRFDRIEARSDKRFEAQFRLLGKRLKNLDRPGIVGSL